MILIIDDKPENLYSLKTILSLHSFPVDTAESGEEALKKVLKNSYALIILDVQMPGMDGFEVAEALSGYSKSKDIPIIFLSAASTEKRFITKGYTSGGIDYITKPIDPDILLLKVKTFYKLFEQTRQLNEMQDILRSEIEFRKQAQAEINAKAQELRSTLESIPQLAFTTRDSGQIEYTNSQWLEYQHNSYQFPVTHPDDPEIAPAFLAALTLGRPFELEVRIKKKAENEYRYHLMRVLPARENDVIVRWVGTFTDIEDQKQAIKRKDEFISIASHELKTPLTTIKAYVQLLERMTEDGTAKNYVERTLFQVKKLDTLITDLLDISRIESGKMKFDKKEFEFEPMLAGAIDMARQTYPDFNFAREGAAQAEVFGDDTRLEQVLVNFISNAVKYSRGRKEVCIQAKSDSDKLMISVKDFGIGIPKEYQADLFKKFYRVEETTTHAQGLGIGLYICSEILDRHDCKYGVESEPDHGSTFYFSIPIINHS
ncbi:MAG: hybrid sensor histidine kinase/response regulator [Chitinophagaceae bacterium]